MKNNNYLSLIFSIPLLIQETSNAENPKVAYVELTDSSPHAGTRKSRNSLKIVKRDSITVNAVANVTEDSPTWKATVGTITPPSGTSATWTGDADSNITASFSETPSSASALVNVAPHVTIEPITIIDVDTATVKKTIEDFNKFINKIGYKTGITASGKLQVGGENVDFYNDGEKLGEKRTLGGEVSATLGELSASISVPTSVLFISITGSAALKLQTFKVTLSGAYDESKEKPFSDFKGGIGFEAGIEVTVGLAVGPPGYDLAEAKLTGKTNVTSTGVFTRVDRDIKLGGAVTANALRVNGSVEWVAGIKFDIAKTDNYDIGGSYNVPFENKTICTLPF